MHWAAKNQVRGPTFKDPIANVRSSLLFKITAKAMLHWIHKGDAGKAAARARELANQVHYMERLGLVTLGEKKAA